MRLDLIGTLFALASMMPTNAVAVGADGDEAAVREAAASFYRALNSMFTGELAPMVVVWSHADDVTYMGPTGGITVGWPAVHGVWERQAAKKLGGKVEPVQTHVAVGRDLAVVVDIEKGENVDADGHPLTVSIRATNVFRKEDGAWKMIGHHTDLLPWLDESEKPED